MPASDGRDIIYNLILMINHAQVQIDVQWTGFEISRKAYEV